MLLPCVLTLKLLTYKYYTSYCLKENKYRSCKKRRNDDY